MSNVTLVIREIRYNSTNRVSDTLETTVMRVVGRRKEPRITFSASAALLKEGARFNEELRRLPTGNLTFIPKGVYCFRTHEEANRHERDCMVNGMVRIAKDRA